MTEQGMGEVLDLFSAAAGGWSLGMHRAGFTTIAACEVEAWRRELYAYNNPNVRLYDDVRTLTASRLRDDLGRLPSVVVGSPPCQDISSANTRGRGVDGARSGLFFEAIRIVGEVRPRWVALENSHNLRTRGADAVIAALEDLGYACWPFVVRAGDIGANHERPRCWLLACDVEQITDADHQPAWWAEQPRVEGQGCHLPSDGPALGDCFRPFRAWTVSGGYGGMGKTAHAYGFGWHARRGWSGFNVSVAHDPIDAASIGYEGRRAWRYGADGLGTPSIAGSDAPHTHGNPVRLAVLSGRSKPEATVAGDNARDSAQDGCGQGLPGRRAEPIERLPVEACGDDAYAAEERPQGQSGRDEPGQGQEPERADVPAGREVGLCSPDSGHADRSGPDWSLAHLADHLRLDDGLSAQLAGTRIVVGDGKGQSAASLVVEAFGDAVVPQIPEAIGRAIIRTERALGAIYGRSPTPNPSTRKGQE